MRYFFVLATILLGMGSIGTAQEWENRQFFGTAQATQTLNVLSSTDTALFTPILHSFVSTNPDIAIEYFEAGTADIDRFVRRSPDAFDIVISSAMDLQFKLANDGFARAFDDLTHPEWAQWRDSLFAFTSEPAAIVINRAAFQGEDVPTTRQDLIRALRARPEVFQGRVGTYDVRQSGLGYLFATQDARSSETFWRLIEVMGNLDARLYCCSSDMIEDVANGKIALAYNVLASYAHARSDLSQHIEVIQPSDFQTIMMRTAFATSGTKNPETAREFIAHLLRYRSTLLDPVALPRLDVTLPPAGQSTIQLEPALLTYLDRLKSRRFLMEWSEAMIQ
ncbi:MAG: ABC transporter substrate-binding protein [Roseobacter sp.]